VFIVAEEGSDFVKLYDLTSLCAEYMNDKDANPFTLPVAILMYRVARNLMRRTTQKRTKRVANTVYRLLNNCLELLNRDKYPQVCHLSLVRDFRTVNQKSIQNPSIECHALSKSRIY
jgi:hypothetical protein